MGINLMRQPAKFEPGKWQDLAFHFQVAEPVEITPQKMKAAMEALFGKGVKFAADAQRIPK